MLASAARARDLRVLASAREAKPLKATAALRAEAERAGADLLAGAAALLDDRLAPAKERRLVYEGLAELRALDVSLELAGLAPLGAERSLGTRFATGAARHESADPGLKTGVRDLIVRFNHVGGGTSDMFTDLAEVVAKDAPPVPVAMSDHLRQAEGAWIRFPVTSTWSVRTLLLVRLEPYGDAAWTFFMHARCGRFDGKDLWLMHRLDPLLLPAQAALSAEVLNLPGTMPGSWPIRSTGVELVGWRE